MTSPKTAAARLYVTCDLLEGAAVDLPGPQAHYLRTVLRLAPGAGLAVFNGRDGEWRARLERLDKAGGTAVAELQTRAQQGGPDVTLCFAPIKRPGIDFIAEKATELGTAVLQPVFTAHTDVTRVNVERLRANAIEAAEQCERLDVPEVRVPVSLAALLEAWPTACPLLLAAERGASGLAAPPLAAAVREAGGPPVAFLIGPEGGFAASELDDLGKLAFVHPVSLGPRILRADTAGLAALACWQSLAGDGGSPPPARTDTRP
ncbi:MAG: 16S rRNA (uracil(1498)-N(3))-methyltransferase [Alphaproteobacteria bacterium]|jgi:16S rRNA (uracil1498-N3)-methyltransferase|nr:16S rRNA (uracil(1498)-N(3))-methyltransferase [Alphaproteobacteria bacterium]